ncbi:MAG: hypothetical protein ACLFR8_09070 [Alkalispirochaeta sp.]
MLDHEDREWTKKFGESYLEYKPKETHLDEEQINRLEEEFFEDAKDPYAPRSPYSALDELPDSPEDS